MFGTHQLLERKLRKSGSSAMATVLASHYNPGNNAGGGGATHHCKLKIRVEPDGAPAFEADTDAWLIVPPKVGGVVPVLYDPSDHDKLVVDHSDEALGAAFREDIRRRTGVSMVDPKQAPSGSTRLVISINGQVQDGGTPGAPAPVSADAIDRLSKLADLHDRGVLTDAEFETQKKALLGEG